MASFAVTGRIVQTGQSVVGTIEPTFGVLAVID